jgi:putative MFS transporter
VAWHRIVNYQAKDFITIVIAQVLCSIAIGTFTVICATFTNELFPTAIRANATAWGNNIIGRLATIFGPALIGILTAPIGIGNAVTLVAGFGALGCALIVIFLLPETKGLVVPDYQSPQARLE